MVAFLGFNSVTGSEFNTSNVINSLKQEAQVELRPTPLSTPSQTPATSDSTSGKTDFDSSQINFRASKSLFAGLSKEGVPTSFTVSDVTGEIGSVGLTGQSVITNPDGFVLVSYIQSVGDDVVNLLLAQSITIDGSGTSYYGSPSITIAGSWFPLTQSGSASTITRLSNGNYLLTATIYIDSTVDSVLFVAATGGLDVDVIPNEISTRIILSSSKSSILAQAINISAKGVK
jgi:hypothetical protein